MSFSTPRSTDICSCSACGKQQERYLFVIENDQYVCVTVGYQMQISI